MIFIVSAIMGAVGLVGKAIDALDEHTIAQAPPPMREVIRHKKNLYDRCPTLPLAVCRQVGIDDLADGTTDDGMCCQFLVSWTDEEAGVVDRTMSAIMNGHGDLATRLMLRRTISNGKARFKHIGKEMDKNGLPK